MPNPALLALMTVGCSLFPTTVEAPPPAIEGQDVHLTLIHTSDLHSRMLPYHFTPTYTDNQLGLPDAEDMGCEPTERCYGGMARVAWIIKQERLRSDRVLVLDTGDLFQGAAIFNEFGGDAEMKVMTEAGYDAVVVGNHDFGEGAAHLSDVYAAYGGFHFLAANYDFESSDEPWASQLEDQVEPSVLFELDGLRVGVVGIGNLSSLTSIYDQDNSMDVSPLATEQAIQIQTDLLTAMGADLIVVLSHLGLDDDFELARNIANPEVDIILGGHHHVVTDPPPVIINRVTGKRIPVVHSGAFTKYVGRIDLVVRDGEIQSMDYELFPIFDHLAMREDPEVAEILADYDYWLSQEYNLSQTIGYAEETLRRFGNGGGDSMLGNFAADAIRFQQGVETEMAITNTLGIRTDLDAGDISLDAMFNAMPFDNTITTMFLSGREVEEVLDYIAYRSSDRGCNAQAQVSGIRFTMDCSVGDARDIYINGVPLDQNGTYELATNNYIAHGGSGFDMLERNTTQTDLGISIRDVVISAIKAYHTLPQPGVAEEEGRINVVY
ncbi:MAG: bifunctional UDP-sugar hydrolase/5'-nucleotidase [Pseudomonadota bacterium]